jgi:hypothetical protein
MPTTVSDYVVVADGTTTLQTGGNIEQRYTFEVPSTLRPAENAIATWRLEAEDPQGLAWNLKINGTQVVAFTHNSDRFAALQEVIGASILKVGTNNATVQVTGGNGRIDFSDFVIHFRARV